MRPRPIAKAHGLSSKAIHGFAIAMLGLPAFAGLCAALVPMVQKHSLALLEGRTEQAFAMAAPFQAPSLPFPPDRLNETLLALDSTMTIAMTMPWRTESLGQRLLSTHSLVQNRFLDMDIETKTHMPKFAALQQPVNDAPLPEISTFYASLPVTDMPDEADQPLEAGDGMPTGSLAENGEAAPVVGRASAEDARTLNVSGQKIRLAGLGLPEKEKKCVMLSGEIQECRQAAAKQLEQFLRFRNVSCAAQSLPGAGTIGRCRVGDTDIAEWLVRRGWAQIEGKDGTSYAKALIFAQNFKLGLWR